MTLNGIVTLILRYFTEFMYNVVVKQLPRFQNLLLIVYDHINTIWQLFSDYLGKTNLIAPFDRRRCIDDYICMHRLA